MSQRTKPVLARVSRRRPLAACVAAVFTLTVPAAFAATAWTVDSCNEANSGSGTTGTLRYAAANAVSGDTIDMTGLTCSTISLLTGAITFAQDSITLNGPGMRNLLVTGISEPYDRVFIHSGTGTLAINDLSVAHGVVVVPMISAGGGCVNSAGIVQLNKVSVYSCQVRTNGSFARGAGIYAKAGLSLKHSVVSGNRAAESTRAVGGGAFSFGYLNAVHSTINDNETSGTYAYGGGIYATGNLNLLSSTVSNNTASAYSGYSRGGGIMSASSFYSNGSSIVANTATNKTGDGGEAGGAMVLGAQTSIYYSTIAGNHSDLNTGGMALRNAAGTATIANSTISGNSAKHYFGGIFSYEHAINVSNSTIAFNTAGSNNTNLAAGLTLWDPSGFATAKLQSVLVANNSYGSPASASDINGNVAVGGGNNLAYAPGSITLPGDTITGQCPLLGPLRDNGGPSLTHALLSYSPGIDQGNNSTQLTNDQRGSPYARVSNGTADIGAYEVQQDDIVFNNSFDGCPP